MHCLFIINTIDDTWENRIASIDIEFFIMAFRFGWLRIVFCNKKARKDDFDQSIIKFYLFNLVLKSLLNMIIFKCDSESNII